MESIAGFGDWNAEELKTSGIANNNNNKIGFWMIVYLFIELLESNEQKKRKI